MGKLGTSPGSFLATLSLRKERVRTKDSTVIPRGHSKQRPYLYPNFLYPLLS